MGRLFDASTELIDIGDVTALQGPSSFWLSAWVRMDALTQDGVVVSTFRTSGNAGWIFFFDDVNPSGNNRMDFGFFHTSGSLFIRCSSTGEVEVNEWHHWVGQYDSTANELRLYKDAVLDNTTTSATVDPDVSDQNVFIGHHTAGDSGRALLGTLAHVRGGLGVLTVGEISTLMYRNASVVTEFDLPLWGDSTEVDISGNGFNGTVTGATVADNPPIGPAWGTDDTTPFLVAAPGGTNPKGPLGHPFYGPFAGPVAA